MRPFGYSGKAASRDAGLRLGRLAWLTLFSATDEPRNLIRTDESEAKRREEGSLPMAIRGRDRVSRHRKRARKRILAAVFVLFGLLLWGVAGIAHLKDESLNYSGITLGGAAVIAGIILFATTL